MNTPLADIPILLDRFPTIDVRDALIGAEAEMFAQAACLVDAGVRRGKVSGGPTMQMSSDMSEAPDAAGAIDTMLAARRVELEAIVLAANRSALRPPQPGEFTISATRADAEIMGEMQIGAISPGATGGIAFRFGVPVRILEPLDVVGCTRRLLVGANEFVETGPTDAERSATKSMVERAITARGRGSCRRR